MAAIAALIFSIFVGTTVWVFMRKTQANRAVAERLAHMGPSVPVLDTSALKREGTRNDLTIESIVTDKIARDLYQGGIRSTAEVRRYHLLRKLALLAPVVLVPLLVLSGDANPKKIASTVMLGGVFYVLVQRAARLSKMKRQKKILRKLPQFLDLMVVCVEAGLGFAAALDRVLKEMDPAEPLAQEFSLMYNGIALSDACQKLGKRCDIQELNILLSAVVQSDQIGSSLGSTLRVQSEVLRDKFKQRMREKAHRIPVLIVMPTLLIFCTVFVLVLGPAFYQMAGTMKKTMFAKGGAAHAPVAR